MILAALLALQSGVAGWEKVESDADGAVYLMRPQDVGAAARAPASVWVKADQSANKRVTERSSMMRYRIDCKDQTIQLQSFVDYDARGSVANSGGYGTVKPIVPDSVGATIALVACTEK